MGHKKRIKSPKEIVFVCVVARVVSTLSLLHHLPHSPHYVI